MLLIFVGDTSFDHFFLMLGGNVSLCTCSSAADPETCVNNVHPIRYYAVLRIVEKRCLPGLLHASMTAYTC